MICLDEKKKRVSKKKMVLCKGEHSRFCISRLRSDRRTWNTYVRKREKSTEYSSLIPVRRLDANLRALKY
jgi:hypothetical protein